MKKLILYIFVAAIAEVSFSERFDRVKFSQDVVTTESDPEFQAWDQKQPQWINDLERLNEYYVSLSVSTTAEDGCQRSVLISQDGIFWKRACNFNDVGFCHQIVPHNGKYIVTYSLGSGVKFGFYELDDISQVLDESALSANTHYVNSQVFGANNISTNIPLAERGMVRMYWSIYFGEDGREYRLFTIGPKHYSEDEKNLKRKNFYGKIPNDDGIYKLYISEGNHEDELSFSDPIEVSRTRFFASTNWLVDRISEPPEDSACTDSLLDPKMHVFNINGTNKYVLAIQDHYRYGIRIYTSTNPASGFRLSASLFDQKTTLYLEGPTIIQTTDGGKNRFMLYATEYSQGYLVCFTTDDENFRNWSQPSPVYYDRVINDGGIYNTRLRSLYPVRIAKDNDRDRTMFAKLMRSGKANPFQQSGLNGFTPPYPTSIFLRNGNISTNNPLVLFPGAVYQPDIDSVTNNSTIHYIDSSYLKVGDVCYFYVPYEGSKPLDLNIKIAKTVRNIVTNYRFNDDETKDNVRILWNPELNNTSDDFITIWTSTRTCNELVPIRRVRYPNNADRVVIEFPQTLIWEARNNN